MATASRTRNEAAAQAGVRNGTAAGSVLSTATDSAAEKVATQPRNRLLLGLESLFWAGVTGAIVWWSDLLNVLLYNQKIFRQLLWVSGGACALWVVILLYIMIYVRFRVGPHGDWTKYDPRIVPAATLCMVVAFATATFAIWPVYHILTIPLLLVTAFFIVNVLSLSPSVLLCTDPVPVCHM